jgi:hypothetical protein
LSRKATLLGESPDGLVTSFSVEAWL